MATANKIKSTTMLLRQYRQGEAQARDELVTRYLPVMQRWARGRLPSYGRDLADTDDLVQVTFMRAINNLERFDPQRPGAFLSYLRTILVNQVREELRRSRARPASETINPDQVDTGLSAVELAVGQQTVDAYEAALAKLPDEQRDAIIMRVEFGMTFPEIASELDRPSANSVRMLVSRALTKVASWMSEENRL